MNRRRMLRNQRVGWSVLFIIVQQISCAELGWIEAARAESKNVRVRLFQAHPDTDSLYVAGSFQILKPRDESFKGSLFKITRRASSFEIEKLATGRAGQKRVLPGGTIVLRSENGRPLGIGRATNAIRTYKGLLRISCPDGKNLICHNDVPLRDYVTAVVGTETLAGFPREALKAQSVLIQTAMLHYRAGDELNDSTEKQAYLGAAYERPEVVAAVRESWGTRILCGDRPLPVYFHSCCAGQTSSSEIFTGLIPKTACDKGVSCRYCKDSPFFKATVKTVPLSLFRSRISETIPKVLRKDLAGRPMEVSYALDEVSRSGGGAQKAHISYGESAGRPEGSAGTASAQEKAKQVKANETAYALWLRIGQELGWDKAPGTRFDIKKISPDLIRISSTGAGHGVGMCQWGARGMAKEGASCEQILKFYFPGAKVNRQP